MHVLQNTERIPETGAKVIKSKGFLHAAACPAVYHRVHIRMGFFYPDQQIMHFLPGLNSLGINLKLFKDVLTHRHTVTICKAGYIRNGIQSTIYFSHSQILFTNS